MRQEERGLECGPDQLVGQTRSETSMRLFEINLRRLLLTPTILLNLLRYATHQHRTSPNLLWLSRINAENLRIRRRPRQAQCRGNSIRFWSSASNQADQGNEARSGHAKRGVEFTLRPRPCRFQNKATAGGSVRLPEQCRGGFHQCVVERPSKAASVRCEPCSLGCSTS